MNFRIAALCGAAVLALSACPAGNNNPDGGTPDSGGIVPPAGDCSAECGPNEVCDSQTHTCVPGCNPACAVGQICVNDNGTYSCQAPATTCNGHVCEPGQTACINGECSCLDFNHAARDTCADYGKVCHQLYDGVSMSGGQCEDPKEYEYCGLDCSGPDCGACEAGTACTEGFFSNIGTCHRTCNSMKSCGVDELCSGGGNGQNGSCFPKSVFSSTDKDVDNPWGCKIPDPQDPSKQVGTHASTQCLAIVDMVSTQTEFRPIYETDGVTGTCTYLFVNNDTQSVQISYCRTAGPVQENGACNTHPMPVNLDQTCSTGLECVPTGAGDNGICMRICNAHEKNGVPGTPGCNEGESCVNIYRTDLTNGNVGACMTSCNVFTGTGPSYGCEPVGSTQTACVPTTAQGAEKISLTGDGFCAPVLGTPKTEGQACTQTDPMTGTDCASGLICTQLPGASQATCAKPCDVACVDTTGTTPARCSSEANATCSGGKTCAAVNSVSGATMGLCQ